MEKILLLFTLHVSLNIRQHFNENNNEEQEGERKEGIVTKDKLVHSIIEKHEQ